MSKRNVVELVCPFCKKKATYDCWSSVNATINPELKRQLLDSRLNKEKCRNCEKEIELVTEILYHDMDKFIMIECFPAQAVEERIERFMLLQSKMKPKEINEIIELDKYRFRYVWSKQQLIEKIKIFDSNLNDRLIEMYKHSLNAFSMLRKDSIYYDNIYFDRLDIENDSMSFFFVKGPRVDFLSVKNNLYRDMLTITGKEYGDKLEWSIVDQEYGKKTLFSLLKSIKEK